MLAHMNNLLPDTHQIDPTYVKAIAAKGFSDQLQQYAILNRFEARLRTLDKKKDGKIVRSWEGTWASDVLETPEYAAFQEPFEDAEGRRTAGGQKRKLLVREREVIYKRYAPPAPAGTSVAEVTSMRSPPTSPPAEGSRRAEHLCR